MAVGSIRGTLLPQRLGSAEDTCRCPAFHDEPGTPRPQREQQALLSSPPLPDHGVLLRDRGHLQAALLALPCTHSPLSTPSYLSLLKASIKSKCLPLVEATHAHLAASHKTPLHGFLGDYLVMALAICGAVENACFLASTLPRLSIFSWTSIISAHAECGHRLKALGTWQRMQDNGVAPDSFTFVSLFKACGAIPYIHQGKNLHALARCEGFTSNVVVGNAILGMYANCGALSEVQNAFNEICYPTTASWNMLLSATLEQGQGQKVLGLYKQMETDEVEPDSFTFVCIFKACSSIPDLNYGKKVHVYVSQNGHLSNPFVGNTIMTMYRKCGALAEVEDAFATLPRRDVVSWSCMLSAYVDQGVEEKAVCLYRQMEEEGITPDQVTLSLVLQALSILAEKADDCSGYYRATKQSWLEIGHALHSQVRRESMHLNILTATSLLSMYGKCGSLTEAENVFSTLEPIDIVAWNAMLSAYAENKEGEKALLLYTRMQKQGTAPNDITFVTVLQACGILREKEGAFINGKSNRVIGQEIGRSLHTDICTKGLETYLPVANTLLSMYGKFHTIIEAESVFKALSECDIVTWNAMFGACRSSGEEEKTLLLYKRIREENVTLDEVSYIYIIQACAEIGKLETCKQVHFDVLFPGHDRHSAVATTLIDAYGSFAAMGEAGVIFNNIPQPNVVSWNASIAGYAREGNFKASLHTLELMNAALVTPNAVSLTSILSVCSHSGLVVEGLRYFNCMSVAHAIPPEGTHFKLLIDLFGRAEDFKRLELLLPRMAMTAGSVIWWCVLDTCCTHGNFELGQQALDHLVFAAQAEP